MFLIYMVGEREKWTERKRFSWGHRGGFCFVGFFNCLNKGKWDLYLPEKNRVGQHGQCFPCQGRGFRSTVIYSRSGAVKGKEGSYHGGFSNFKGSRRF